MKAGEPQQTCANHFRAVRGPVWLRLCFLGLMLLGGLCQAQPATGTPSEFFTNVAARLLKSQLGLELTNLPIYPTDGYTPAVHRLLQVAANLYDATTNRAFAGTTEPYCPTVFRPLFRRSADGQVVIAGYREVSGTALAAPASMPPLLELDADTNQVAQVPLAGTPFAPDDQDEPMVSGVPMVIGAKRGFPNFNEFSMQTAVYVSRLLEFRRAVGDLRGPIVQTNQMYVLAITNAFGLEAWNSYSNPYPRNLRLFASAQRTAILSNEFGTLLSSNRFVDATTNDFAANAWPGWHSIGDSAGSFQLPWGSTNSVLFLPPCTYRTQPPALTPQSHVFELGTGLTAPHLFLNLTTRLLFALVDVDAGRIVDYVNLNRSEPTIDIMGVLAQGAICGGPLSSDIAAQWCTNLQFTSSGAPMGIVNQIGVSLGVYGTTLPAISSFSQDPYAGLDAQSAVDGFRYNLMGWTPIFPKDQGKQFYKSNVFYVPFDPYRPIYLHNSWQANDPLVHYTLYDLSAYVPGLTNLDFVSHNPPLSDVGSINQRYQPWGGGPAGSSNPSMAPTELAAEDPSINRSDAWNFPTNQALEMSWVGRVHRGTPWQTLFLKSTNILWGTGAFLNKRFANWQEWTGDYWLSPGPGSNSIIADAFFTLPTNDWHLATMLASLWNTNDLRTLASPNETSAASWAGLLDGMTVLTNVSSFEMDSLLLSSNSPQATVLAQALLAARASQPGGAFYDPGSVLATPELSIASPWLSNASTPSDEAYEVLPAQLLARLRADSVGTITQTGGQVALQFTGYDGYGYAVQASSNLVDWVTVSTNYPSSGRFSFPEPSGAQEKFYRSVLLR